MEPAVAYDITDNVHLTYALIQNFNGVSSVAFNYTGRFEFCNYFEVLTIR